MRRRSRIRLTDLRRDDLAGRHYGLAILLSRPYRLSWPSLADDFRSEAGYALTLAAEAWESPRGVRFPAFARKYVEGAMLGVMRQAGLRGWRKHGASAPKSVTLPRDAESEGRVLGITPESPPCRRLDEADALDAMLAPLPPRHADICRMVFAGGMTGTEAGAVHGICQSRASWLRVESLAYLSGSRPSPRLAEIA